MTDESFMPISEATKNILQKDQLITQYSEIESMMYNTKPCQLKTLWKSSSKDHHSMAFQKGCCTFQAEDSTMEFITQRFNIRLSNQELFNPRIFNILGFKKSGIEILS